MTALADWNRSSAARTLALLTVFAAALWYFAGLDRRFALDTDDAYITYRYAQNLADGAGFVYNTGERVLGTTTPLLTLMLAAVARTGVSIPHASAGIGIASAALALTVVAAWLFRLTGSSVAAALGALLLVSVPKFVLFAVSGMETSLYVLAIISSCALYDRSRFSAAAVVAAMAALVRLDGIAVGAALVLHYVAVHRRLPPLRAIVAYVLPLLSWVVFAWLYFGNVLPQSMLAKHGHAMAAGRWWMLDFCASAEALPYWALAIAGLVLPIARRTTVPAGVQALAIWTVAYIAAYSLYRIDMYQWYLSPLAAALVVLGVFGAATIFRIGEAADQATVAGAPIAVLGCALVMAPLCIAGRYSTSEAVAAMVEWTNTVERARSDAAAQIRRDGRPDDLIATGAIGIVGWTTRAPMYDTMALVTPAAAGVGALESLRRSRATWFITETAQLHAAPSVVPGYALAGAFNRDATPTFLLYRRVALPPDSRQAGIGARFVSGLVIESAVLRADRLEVMVSVSRRQERNYKFFAHVHEDGKQDGTPTRLLDFYPVVPTSQMTPGALFSSSISIAPALSSPLATVSVGLFDEADPAFTRLADEEGRNQIVLTVSPQ